MNETKGHFISIGLILFFMSGTVYVTTEFKALQMPLLIISLLIMMFSFPLSSVINYKKSIVRTSYLSFVFFSFFSSLINEHIKGIISSLGMLFLWYVCTQVLPQVFKIDKNGGTIYRNAFMHITLPFVLLLVYSVLKFGFKIERYRGVFYTSNSTGGCAATIVALSCSLLLFYCVYETDNKKFIYRELAVISAMMVLCLASTSRTSIIASSAIIFVTFLLYLYYSEKSRSKVMSNLFLICFLLVAAYCVYKFTAVHEMVNSVLVKFNARSTDELAGRSERWELVIERMKFWGNGADMSRAAHNTYLGLLDQFGILACISWIVFILSGLICSIKIVLKKSNSKIYYFKFIPFYSFLMFILLSLTEGMMLKTIMLMCIYSVPLLYIDETSDEHKTKMIEKRECYESKI